MLSNPKRAGKQAVFTMRRIAENGQKLRNMRLHSSKQKTLRTHRVGR